MKYFLLLIATIILFIAFQFIFYRSVPIIGSFPVIKSKIVLKQNGEIILVIAPKGTYQISRVRLFFKEKMIYSEISEESEPSNIEKISDLPKVKMPYRERIVYITLPKNAFDKITLIDGMVFNLVCYGSFDQYFSASGRNFNIESKVIHEK